MDEDDISSVMGFGSFGSSKASSKKARTFDLDAQLAQTRKGARERFGTSELAPAPAPQPEKRRHNEIEDDGAGRGSTADESPGTQARGSGSGGEDDDSDEKYSDDDEQAEAENEGDRLPIGSHVDLKHGVKIISAVALDPSGARLVTGSYDYDIQLWDFNAMDSSLRSFRTKTPWEGYQVNGVAYSATGDMFSVATTSAQAKVYDRNAGELLETIKGDHYLHDMTRTKGHISCINATCWHPRRKEIFLTGGDDGTVRLWDVNGQGKKHVEVVKVRQRQARRLPVISLLCSADGKHLVAGCQDGSLQLYPLGGPYVRPALIREGAHAGGFVSCALMKGDGRGLLSRGADGAVRLWDIRALRQQPVAEARGLTTLQPMMNMALGPTERALAVPLAAADRSATGCMSFLDAGSLRELHRTTPAAAAAAESGGGGGSSPVCCLWHPKLNQVVFGCDKGNVSVLYDSKLSVGGVTQSLKRRRKLQMSATAALSPDNMPIILPNSLKMFREERYQHGRKREEKQRKDPVQSRRPELPMHGHGKGGRVAGQSSLASYVGQNIAKRVLDNSDPRQAILRHAEEAKNDPYWVTPAYAVTQPKPIFEKTEDEGEDEAK